MNKPMKSPELDMAGVSQSLVGKQGPELWRSLEELADTPAFREAVDNEFAAGAPEWSDGFSRRRFLQLMGASLALAGLHGCTRPAEEKIVPYVNQPQGMTPGMPLYYASTHTLGGIGRGILVQQNMGRPTKIDGNDLHPATPGYDNPLPTAMRFGAADVFALASILSLYDPDRSQAVKRLGRVSSWETFSQVMGEALVKLAATKGDGLRILTEATSSPALADQFNKLMVKFPGAQWHQFEAVNQDAVKASAMMAFGNDVRPIYHFEKAAVVLALDSDFLTTGPAAVRYAHDFAWQRRVRDGHATMNRLYAVESNLTSTGGVADHRLALKPSEIERFARALAVKLGVGGVSGGAAESGAHGWDEAWLNAVAEDLAQAASKRAALVVAGEAASPQVQALAHAINAKLNAIDATVTFIDPVLAYPVDQAASLAQLVADMRAGKVSTLIVIGANPVYAAPAEVDFTGALAKVELRIHMGLYEDETAFQSHWHLPLAHELETWGDARAFDGTASLVQPLIAPLYQGRSSHELLSLLLGEGRKAAQKVVKDYWKKQYTGLDFELAWRKALHDGVIENTVYKPRQVSLAGATAGGWLSQAGPTQAATGSANTLEIAFHLDPAVYDGRFANNGWLQELPRPVTKLVWDNAALLSPATALRLHLNNGDVIRLTIGKRAVEVPVWITPGHADDSVSLTLGYGRERAGKVGTGIGVNVNALRSLASPWREAGVKVEKTGATYKLVSTQDHHTMHGRGFVRTGTLLDYIHDPRSVAAHGGHGGAEGEGGEGVPLTLYEPFTYEGTQWGMSIDLTSCVGCNACVIACQSENNIAVVGKEQVANGREMHWLRIDQYYEGDPQSPDVSHVQPVACMHCESAPCEVVCPVGATTHSDDGLNEMVYNRCVGTRYCSNNCPYKVRRFNFLEYQRPMAPSVQLMQNPEVTVRQRGVMEKCTYCVQRIRHADIDARKDSREILDGEVVTACQASCPTQAIVFGNINDPQTRVSMEKAPRQAHAYGMLTELNTKPRTTYLARIRNINPKLAKPAPSAHGAVAH